ncbi:hypothetical protein GCM10020254_45440 [Streptomyces goshikiensis]
MRKVMDCREYPSDIGCTLTIMGEEDEVMGGPPSSTPSPCTARRTLRSSATRCAAC